uniref:Chitin-binding type-2 domain-containing protein n=1 Tax=Panagrolaimus sp. ES5 TaxID=591445 RepID=A0AC34GAK2_9BILA
VAVTPAPAWVPYSGQQQIQHPEAQRNQMPVQQHVAANPAPAWVPYPSQQQQQQSQQPAVPHPQVNYQPQPQPLIQQSANSQLQQSNVKNSYEKQILPSKIVETFCRDNNLRDGLNGAGCAPYFFICALKETTRLHCPTGLYYDEEIHECGLKTTITACGGQKLSATPAQQQAMPQGSYGTSSSSTHWQQQQPALPEFDCQQRQDGVYVLGCSSKYYICNQKKSKTLFCPPGTYFSASTELCDYKAHIVECGGIAQTISHDSQHPVLIPQKPYPRQPLHQMQGQQQQQTAASNYEIQFNSKMKNSQGESGKKLPLGAKYPPWQQLQQNPPVPQVTSSPPAVALPEDDKCKNLSSGIYGNKCSKFFFVCVEKKSFDFMCPKDQAFNLATVKCAPKTQIFACREYKSALQQPAVHKPQTQQQPQQTYVPQPQIQQTYNPHPPQQNTHSQQLPINNHVQNQPIQQQQPVVAVTPAPAWVPYSGQQ